MAGSSRQERAWVRGARDGSAADLEALFREHWPRAYRAAFLAALRALDRFDRRRPFGPWLHRIVVNRAIDWARARRLRGEVFAEGLVEVAAPAVEAPASRAPYADATVAALAALSPEHRAVIVLRYLLEYTPGEIAELLELPRGTVNSRLRRGLDQLGGRLDEDDR
jgi:RNA polymerase sigma-70 factor (ECF subfamily)